MVHHETESLLWGKEYNHLAKGKDWQPTEWEIIFYQHLTPGRGQISKIYKVFKQHIVLIAILVALGFPQDPLWPTIQLDTAQF